jgi:hypothetical protein
MSENEPQIQISLPEIMVRFDLYDELKDSVEKLPPNKNQAKQVCSVLNSIPKEHREMIYLLILHHNYLHQGSGKGWRSNPYKGQTFEGGRGVKFNWMALPVPLQIIIIRYLERITEKE